MTKQVFVFLENRPGHLAHVTGVIAQEEINIRSVTIASAGNFGLVKLIVDRPDQAYEALKKQGLSTNLQEVLALVMEDRTGGLHSVLEAFARKGLNVKDACGFVEKPGERAVLILEVEDLEAARGIARDAGLQVYEEELHRV
ncbi:MAG: ACT domain-containing protein [Thermodesulfobacteriota bacterium]